MSKVISISIDSETEKKFEEISQIMKKNRSELFRQFVHYFYKHKDNLSNGIHIKLPGEEVE